MKISVPTRTNKPVSHARKARLASLEETIRAGFETFAKTGAALVTIRDERLFADDFDSFEVYCAEVWGISRARAYQLIDAGRVLAEVRKAHKSRDDNESAPTMVGAQIDDADEVPNTERQTRALGKAPEGERAETWKQAQEESGKKQPTTNDIQKVVAKRIAARTDDQPSTPSADAPPFAEFVREWEEEIKPAAVALANRLSKWLDANATTRKPANPWAHFITYDAAAGSVRQMIRAVDDNVPGAMDDKAPGFIPVRVVASRESMKKNAA